MSKAATDVISTDFGWDDEVFLSFLPASHAYEHTGGQHFPIGLGAQIYYAEGLEKLAANIEEVRPTIMVVVPRLFEMLRARIMKPIEKQGGLSKYLLARALKIGGDKAAGTRQPWDLPMDGFLSLTLRRKKSAPSSAGGSKAMVSGGAPLNPEVGLFFQSLGHHLPAGLWPDRDRAGDQPATGRAPASGSTRSARRSRIPRCGSPRTARSWSAASSSCTAIGATRKRPRGCSRTAGWRPATSAISTTRAGSTSPTARRT